jgi:ubiquinone/menaquinone biosynthesis C-methylase UbiE
MMEWLRRGIGLVVKDGADTSIQELWSRYQACCVSVMTDASVLDVGCAFGEQSDEVLGLWHARRYTGADLSVGLVRDAKLRYSSLDFIAADGCFLPLKDSCFDVVTSSFLFHHIPVPVRTEFLQEQLRVGTEVLLRDLFGMESGWVGWLYKVYYRVFDGSEYRFTLREWHQFIESAGGKIIQEAHTQGNVVRNRHCFFLIRRD